MWRGIYRSHVNELWEKLCKLVLCTLLCIKHTVRRQFWLKYLHICKLLLFLPVPHRQDVVVGIVHRTQMGSTILRNRRMSTQPVMELTAVRNLIHYEMCNLALMISFVLKFWAYRLAEGHTSNGSIKHSSTNDMQGIQADRVPHPDMWMQLLGKNRQSQGQIQGLAEWCHHCKSLNPNCYRDWLTRFSQLYVTLDKCNC